MPQGPGTYGSQVGRPRKKDKVDPKNKKTNVAPPPVESSTGVLAPAYGTGEMLMRPEESAPAPTQEAPVPVPQQEAPVPAPMQEAPAPMQEAPAPVPQEQPDARMRAEDRSMDRAQPPSNTPLMDAADAGEEYDVRGAMEAEQKAEMRRTTGMDTYDENQRIKEANRMQTPEQQQENAARREERRIAREARNVQKEDDRLAEYEDSGFEGTQEEYFKDKQSRSRYQFGIDNLTIPRDTSYEEWEEEDYERRFQRKADRRQKGRDEQAANKASREERRERFNEKRDRRSDMNTRYMEAKRMGLTPGTPEFIEFAGGGRGQQDAREQAREMARITSGEGVERIKADAQKYDADAAVQMHGATMANNLGLKEMDIKLGLEQIYANERMATQFDRLTRDKMPFEVWAKQMDVWSQMETVNAGMMGAVLSAASDAGYGDQATLYAQTYVLGKGNMGDTIQSNPDMPDTSAQGTGTTQAISQTGTSPDPNIANQINNMGAANQSQVPPPEVTRNATGTGYVYPDGTPWTPPPSAEDTAEAERIGNTISIPGMKDGIQLTPEEKTAWDKIDPSNLAGTENDWVAAFSDIDVGDWGSSDIEDQKYASHMTNMERTLQALADMDEEKGMALAKKLALDPAISQFENAEWGGVGGTVGAQLEDGQKGFLLTLQNFSRGIFEADAMWKDTFTNRHLNKHISKDVRKQYGAAKESWKR